MPLSLTRAFLQLLSPRNDLLMFAPTSDLSVLCSVARALSEPARSRSENFPTLLTLLLVSIFDFIFSHNLKVAWDLDEASFARVGSVV